MKTKTLICDIDGCLANWNDAFRALLESLHGPRTVQTLEQALTSWDWPKRLGYTNREIDQAWEKVDWDWWFGLEPYEGVEEAIRRLSQYDGLEDVNDDFQVYYVTGRHASAKHASMDWLNKMGACHPSVITCSRKAELAGVFAQDGPVLVIEDKPTLIEAYWMTADVDLTLIVDQPYNRALPATTGTRCQNISEAIDTVVRWFALRDIKTETPPVTEAKDNV